MVLHHPYTFGNETKRRVEEWRAKKIAELEIERIAGTDLTDVDQQINAVRYGIPPESSP